MSELALLEAGPYVEPEGVEDFGERQADGKKFFLYLGDKAIVDVVELHFDDQGREVLGNHLLRLTDSPEKGPDMLNHTSLELPEDLAKAYFGGKAA